MSFLVFYVPCPDEATALRLSEQMVGQQLAACANIFPIKSLYVWQDELQKDQEWVCLLKTRPELENALEVAVTSLHPYELPCILRYEARANEAYETWIRERTQAEK